jgi:MFS transporter, ACS family, pantothenate transporter
MDGSESCLLSSSDWCAHTEHRWLFVVDGIISLPIALSGYFMLPDLPENCRALYLTKEERAFGKKRMELEGRKGKQPYTRTKNGVSGGQPVFAQYLKHNKDPKYEVWQINVYPTATYAVQIVATLAFAWSSDTVFRGARWPPIVIGGLLNILCYVSLAVWDIAVGWKWTCLILMGAGYGLSGLCFAWAHEICSDDNEERALVTATMNEMAYMCQAWLPLLVWQQVDAPRYQKGYITITCLSLCMIVTAFTLRYLHQRQDEQ